MIACDIRERLCVLANTKRITQERDGHWKRPGREFGGIAPQRRSFQGVKLRAKPRAKSAKSKPKNWLG